jgi:large subunit ribosomal protein L14
MIQAQSFLKIIDNSGGKLCRCIRVLNRCTKTKIGDLAVVSLRKVKPRKKIKVKKGEIRLALIVYTRRPHKRKDGTSLIFTQNYAILVTPQGKALGTRYHKPLARELRVSKWLKVISIAPALI